MTSGMSPALSLSGLAPRIVVLLAGLIGAAGVAMAAAATHMGGALLGPASAMCLAHAPAMLALHAGYRAIRTATLAGLLMGLGVVLFAGDLALKHAYGIGILPMAAPIGGLTMICGWLLVAIGALLPPNRH